MGAETLEGTVDARLWYHYDLKGDVLYLRLTEARNEETLAEETPDGLLLLRREVDGKPVGVTIVNWWRRFGAGDLPDSIRYLEERIGQMSVRIAA